MNIYDCPDIWKKSEPGGLLPVLAAAASAFDGS